MKRGRGRTERDGGNRGQTEMRMPEKDDRRNTLVIQCSGAEREKKKNSRCFSPKKIYDTADIMSGCLSSQLMRFIYGHSKFLLNWKIGTIAWCTDECRSRRKWLESKNDEAALLLGESG